MNYSIEQIARIAHEANKLFCESIGDFSQHHWNEAPEWQKNSAMHGVVFHLSGDYNPDESHNNWLAEKEANGWKYGAIKDEVKKEHPCFVPYEELPQEQRLKDYLFSAIVKAFRDCK